MLSSSMQSAFDEVAKRLDHGFSKSVVAEVQALIDKNPDDAAVNAVWQDIQDIYKCIFSMSKRTNGAYGTMLYALVVSLLMLKTKHL